jgi:hypothetical protein
VGARAVPTELLWNTPLRSPPSAVVACNASTGWSAAGRSRGGLTGGRPSLVSSSGRRDSMPSARGWAGRSPVAGCLPWASSCATTASGEGAGTAASSTGKDGRANGATARRAPKQAASQRCSLSPRCARAPTGTSILSRAASGPARSRRRSAAQKHGPGHERRQAPSTAARRRRRRRPVRQPEVRFAGTSALAVAARTATVRRPRNTGRISRRLSLDLALTAAPTCTM